MRIDEGNTQLGKHLLTLHQVETLRLVVFILLLSGSLAACQTAATQPTDTTLSGQADSDPVSTAGLIRLQDPLDEPEYYCVDVPGAGSSLNLQGALQAHTCKLSDA